MWLAYRLATGIYFGLIHLAGHFSSKARLWAAGRRSWQRQLKAAFSPGGPTLWLHCASLGEFEQGRPVLEGWKRLHPEYKIALTFFSPSGYEVRKAYPLADWVGYLPQDSPRNAREFLHLIQPTLVVFVKYDLWASYVVAVHQAGIPQVLISANPRKGKGFVSRFGRLFYRGFFQKLNHVFAQNETGTALIREVLKYDRVTVAGDTRFDRVVEVAAAAGVTQPEPVQGIRAFIGNRLCLVAGSTWPPDEALIWEALTEYNKQPMSQTFCLIMAPHQLSEAGMAKLETVCGGEAIRYSALGTHKLSTNKQVLIIDSIGLLSRLYSYADLCWVGGGFGAGIHNTLEAAVYGKRVLFGPRYARFPEAEGLVACGAAASITEPEGLLAELIAATHKEPSFVAAGPAAAAYVAEHTGATEVILAALTTLLNPGYR